jgi:CDGSH-type Zn-finger protein
VNATEKRQLLLADALAARAAFLGPTLARLESSIIRPLASLTGQALDPSKGTAAGKGSEAETKEPGELLWDLAQRAAQLFSADPSLELGEAAAALQDLALRNVGSEAMAQERLSSLKTANQELGTRIRTSPNGPLIVINVERFTNWLGEALPMRPLIALCRCGVSSMKPYCDGSHAENGFLDAKDPKRVADRRDTYIGEQVSILDNRGTCQHSGYCTDHLANVFHAKTEPFVTPSGGRMDEIIRAVRDCPSGALSYAIDGVEARDSVDHHHTRPPAIEVTRDGPYRITGAIALEDTDGKEVSRNTGASHEHFALCRCGHAQNKPFCTGMHWYVEFKDPVRDADAAPTIYEWAGGLPAFTRMTRIFYEKYVPADDLLAPLFSTMAADHPERVAKWLSEVFCGPHYYSQEYGGYPRMLSQHLGKCLTEDMRARWVLLLLQSAKEAGLPNDAEFASAFQSYIAWGSRLAVENSQTNAKPPEHMPMPHWDWRTAAGPPGSRISAQAPLSEEREPAVRLPAPEEPVEFAKHVKALFRKRDRQSMQFAFDLWSYADVSKHAEAILERLRNGSMPCDGAWPQERVAVFARWIASGKTE